MRPGRRGAYVKDGDAYTLNGTFEFTGLSIGFYRVDESVLPAGYVKKGDDPVFEVRQKAGSASELEVVLYQKKTDGTYEAVDTGSTLMIRVAGDGKTLIVGNTPGATLPNTGGPGTRQVHFTGFIISGAAAAGLLVRRRKRKRAWR